MHRVGYDEVRERLVEGPDRLIDVLLQDEDGVGRILEMGLSGNDLGWSAKTDLICGVYSSDRSHDGFQGTKCFGSAQAGETGCKCSTSRIWPTRPLSLTGGGSIWATMQLERQHIPDAMSQGEIEKTVRKGQSRTKRATIALTRSPQLPIGCALSDQIRLTT